MRKWLKKGYAIILMLSMIAGLSLQYLSFESKAAVEQATPEELGYEKVMLTDFDGLLGEKRTRTFVQNDIGAYYYMYNGTSLSGKYIDMDVSFDLVDTTQTVENYISIGGNDGYSGLRVGGDKEGLQIGRDKYLLSQLGLETVKETFNLKVAVELSDSYTNSDGDTARDITYSFWVNDVLVAQDAKLENLTNTGLNIGCFTPTGQITISIPNYMPGDLGYKRVVLKDFGIEDGTYQKEDSGAAHAAYGTYNGDSLDETYLDVDVSFGANQGAGTSIRYGNADGWQGIQIYATSDGKFGVWATPGNDYVEYTAQEIGIESVTDTFNVKLGVDFGEGYKGTESANCSATLCLWINNKLIVQDMQFSSVSATGNQMSIVTDAGKITVSTPDVVIYDASYSISDYWSPESKTAPIKEGYVFGGWFQEAPNGAKSFERLISEDGTTTLKCVPLTPNDIDEGITAYAKFVPAQVLSVKAQNSQIKDSETGVLEKVDKNNIETISKDNSLKIRVMSSLDSTNYEKVGFDIYLANKARVKNKEGGVLLETTKVYDGVLEGETVAKANDIFGGVSKYVSVWKLVDIDTPSNKDKIIYVRPYWYTMDGTKVEGLAKYVHIEDDYMNYISVPINLLDKEVAAQVAGGAVNMTYANGQDKAVALKFIEVEAGRLLPEMASNLVDNTIKMVGNAQNVDSDNKDSIGNLETLYANIRFQKPEDAATDVDVDFSTVMIKFCNWDEKELFINEKWDVKYDVKETTSE